MDFWRLVLMSSKKSKTFLARVQTLQMFCYLIGHYIFESFCTEDILNVMKIQKEDPKKP